MTERTEKVADLIGKAQQFRDALAEINQSQDMSDGSIISLWLRTADTLGATVREMHARELHHFEEEQARAKAEAERDEARIWAETMQAQKFEWEGKEAAVRAERDEALSAIADAREVLMPVYPASLGPVGEELVRILSRIPEHPKED